jgi:UDP-3-O-[3-hydroxymyristoyl] glucosamine N-acyltransferase
MTDLIADERLGDARFFARSGPFTASHIASLIAAAITGDGTRLLSAVAPLQTARGNELSVLHNLRYREALRATGAGAVIVSAELAADVPPNCIALIAADPHLAWALAATLFHPMPAARPGTHPSAVIDPAAIIDPSADIGPLAVIGANAEIGPRCRIAAHASISAGVVLGPDCRIGAHASVSHAMLGARVYIYPGARIGQEGFGFAITKTGFVTVPQLGRVILGDDVEIGANSCVDRGAAQDTMIGAGTRVDNLVQIAHGVRIGKLCAIASQAGLSGSTTIGDYVQIGGQAGFAGHLSIGDQARIGAQAGVMSNIEAGADVVGSPAMPKRQVFMQIAALKRLTGASAITKAGTGKDRTGSKE